MLMGILLDKIKSIKARRCMAKLMSDQMYSLQLREIYKTKYGIDVGLYSYGCFDYRRFNRGVIFGRYCSVADSVLRFGRNHPMRKITMHPFFYNKSLGYVDSDILSYSNCVIEDDVWIGANSVILPKVQCIGRGSVIAAGSIVTKDVGRYSIVAGNPARVIGERFSEDERKWVEETQWWLKDINELMLWLDEIGESPLNPLKSKLK